MEFKRAKKGQNVPNMNSNYVQRPQMTSNNLK